MLKNVKPLFVPFFLDHIPFLSLVPGMVSPSWASSEPRNSWSPSRIWRVPLESVERWQQGVSRRSLRRNPGCSVLRACRNWSPKCTLDFCYFFFGHFDRGILKDFLPTKSLLLWPSWDPEGMGPCWAMAATECCRSDRVLFSCYWWMLLNGTGQETTTRIQKWWYMPIPYVYIYIYMCVCACIICIYLHVYIPYHTFHSFHSFHTFHTFHTLHTYIHTYLHTCIDTCIDTYTHTHIHACMHAYMHTCIHACIHACMHTSIRTHMQRYIHTCTHACMHTYRDTYITLH